MNSTLACRLAALLPSHTSNRILKNEAEERKTVAFAKLRSSLCLNCHWCNRTSRAYSEDNRLMPGFRVEVAENCQESFVCLSVKGEKK